jgi:GNAT superfamily N-acetyltransferase
MLELRRLVQELSADDLGMLDTALGEWARRPLGREALAGVVLPAAGSSYVCLLSYEPAGLMVLERGRIGARIRALAVAPDLRRRGVARTLLEAADDLSFTAGLDWLWLAVPASNVPATSCALACGYRRYRPQFLRRRRTGMLSPGSARTRVELLESGQARGALERWVAREASQGDAWCESLASADLLDWNLPEREGGRTYAIVSDAEPVGAAHVAGHTTHPRIWLWLDRAQWATPNEINAFRSVLDALGELPAEIDVEFGSSGHLRASVEPFRDIGFRPILRERVVMVKAVR